MTAETNTMVDVSGKNHLPSTQNSASALARTVDGTVCQDIVLQYAYQVIWSPVLVVAFLNSLILPLMLHPNCSDPTPFPPAPH